MKVLLRSCFIVDPKDTNSAGGLLRNFSQLYGANLDFEVTEDHTIWDFIKDFVRAYNHVPDIKVMRDHFVLYKEESAEKRLAALAEVQPLMEGNFTTHLMQEGEKRRSRLVEELLKEASDIATNGRIFSDGRNEDVTLKGPMDAIRHILTRSHDIVAPTLSTKLSGEVTRDGKDFKEEYLRVSTDPLSGVGQHSGIWQMDTALNGAKKYELWIHAAFTGGLKSTLMLNWFYNQAVWFGFSNLMFSLEMPYAQCRRILYAIHSTHIKFSIVRHRLGLQPHLSASTVGLPYEHIRDGTLAQYHPNAEKFLNDYVIPDFNGEEIPELMNLVSSGRTEFRSPKQYGKIYIEVPDPESSDFTMADLRHKAETIYSQTPFHMIGLDHALLVSPRKWVSSTTERLNEVIRDCKRLAMSFNRGQGIPLLALFQLSREGYKAALKIKEKTGSARYDLTHLSYANEAERSADIVTTSWLDDDLRKANRVLYQCLKSRDQKPFEPFEARVEWATRRLVTCKDVMPSAKDNEQIGSALDFGKALD